MFFFLCFPPFFYSALLSFFLAGVSPIATCRWTFGINVTPSTSEGPTRRGSSSTLSRGLPGLPGLLCPNWPLWPPPVHLPIICTSTGHREFYFDFFFVLFFLAARGQNPQCKSAEFYIYFFFLNLGTFQKEIDKLEGDDSEMELQKRY